MPQVIVVRNLGTTKEFWVRSEKPLTPNFIDLEHFDPKTGKASFSMRERSYPKLAVALARALLATTELKTDGGIAAEFVRVELRPGYYWNEVQPKVIAEIKKALGWTEEPELLSFLQWLRRAKSEVDPDEEEAPNPDELGMVVEKEKRSISYSLPTLVANTNWHFQGPPEGHDTEDKDAYKRIGDNAIALLKRLFDQIEGISEVHLERYGVSIQVGDAFQVDPIHEEVLRALQEIYQLQPIDVAANTRDVNETEFPSDKEE